MVRNEVLEWIANALTARGFSVRWEHNGAWSWLIATDDEGCPFKVTVDYAAIEGSQWERRAHPMSGS